MTNPGHLFLVFIFGFGVGITTHMLSDGVHKSFCDIDTDGTVHQREIVNLDPFPLPPCNANRTSAVYVLYGTSFQSNTLFDSIKTLLKSNFPGRVRVVVDQIVNETIRERMDPKHKHLLNEIEFNVVPMPDLNDKELIPHSNKIRALQAGAFVYGDDSDECTVTLDTDIYVHSKAPWKRLLSTLQLNDIAVARDCEVAIADVPDYLDHWMPNTGVLALRNTPRTRMVLKDWLDYYVPCNATHVSTCTPGTDQYSFLQLAAKHAVRLHKLDNSWNCRLAPAEIDAGITDFPVYSVSVLCNKENPRSEGASFVMTCGGTEHCYILHGHWLKFD